ncbi:hypothetical protein [Photobacterium leiognathi]|uniref:hypothetical protein n=1 Tax=Photobacterium leiognathi TaxID=553611 RepID=UPI002982A7F6|nr:hypothetical protein [Photobacterium leiognathi]
MIDFVIALITFPVALVDWVLSGIFTGISELFSTLLNIGTIIGFAVLAKIFLGSQYRLETMRARQEMRRAHRTWR